MLSSTRVLRFGETDIHYTLTYAQRKTAAIEVHPDGSVHVKAPEGAEAAAVEAFVRRRAPWILRRQAEFGRYPQEQPPRRYVSGESFVYLGRQYRLKVVEGEREWVKLSRGYLEITTPSTVDAAAVRLQVEEWQQKQARRVSSERILALLPRFSPLSLPDPDLTIHTLHSPCRRHRHVSQDRRRRPARDLPWARLEDYPRAWRLGGKRGAVGCALRAPEPVVANGDLRSPGHRRHG